MTIQTWPTGVNSKFFGANNQPIANTEEISYMSGRRVAWQVNTKKLMKWKCRLFFTHSELALFWTWFNDVLGQTAGYFTCSGLGNGVYRFSDIPSPEDTDQTTRVLSMNIEEV